MTVVEQVTPVEQRGEGDAVRDEQIDQLALRPLEEPRLDQPVHLGLVLPLHGPPVPISRLPRPLRLAHQPNEPDPLVDLRSDQGDETVLTPQHGVRVGAVGADAAGAAPGYASPVDEPWEVVAGEERAQDVVDRHVDVLALLVDVARQDSEQGADGPDHATLQLGLAAGKWERWPIGLADAV